MWGHNVGLPWPWGVGNKVLTWACPVKAGHLESDGSSSSLGSISPPAGETSGPQFPHLLIGN